MPSMWRDTPKLCKPGYSGVAIYTRNTACCPIRSEEGVTGTLTPPNSSTSFRDLPEDQQIGGYPRPGQLSSEVDEATLDSEGRCVILEFPAFVLIGTYSPANRDSSRDGFRLGYLEALDARVRNLVAAGKQVILTGDLNVSREELDSCNVKEMLRKEGMSVEDWMGTPSRRLFNHLVFDGQVAGARDEGREAPVLYDLTRIFHPSRQGMFTCWDTKRNTRPANNGSRIDYILCSAGIKDWFTDSNIQEGLMGSDHCPVYATLGDVVKANDKDTSVLDLMNPGNMFRDGKRLREWSAKDLLPLSARLIPEFDRRRNIRDMFMKKPAAKPASNSKHPLTIATEEPHTSKEKEDRSQSQLPVDEPSTSQASIQSNAAKLPPTNNKPSSLQTKSPTKRPAEITAPTKRGLKRTKTNESESAAKANGGLAQSSLMGFFKPKQPASRPPPPPPSPSSTAGTDTANNDVRLSQPSPTKNKDAGLVRSLSGISEPPSVSAGSPSKPAPPPPSASSTSALDSLERVFDPIEVKESWSKFNLGKRVVPKCEHGEPCMILQTKKPGVNCGKSHHLPAHHAPDGESSVVLWAPELTPPVYRQIVLHLPSPPREVGGEGKGH